MNALGIFGMFGGLVFPIILILAIVAAVRAIVRTVRIPHHLAREPACEVCRYRVAGLTTLNCPECGTDLRATGIITLPMEVKRRSSLTGAIFGWVFLMLLAGGVAASVISMLMVAPMISSMGGGTSMTTTTPLTPASGAYTRLDVISTISYGPGMPSGSADYALVKADGSKFTLTFAPLGASYTVTDPSGAATTTSNDGKGPDALFAGAGLDGSDPKISAEVRELATVIGVLGATPYTAVNTIRLRAFTTGAPSIATTAGTQAGPDTTYTIVFLVGALAWLGLLTGGIIFIVFRRKKLLRQYVGATPQPSAPLRA